MNDEKTALGRKILRIKTEKGLTWAEIAARLDHAPVFVCAACLGQMSFTRETAEKAAALFGLDAAEAALLAEIPYRGSIPTVVPTDPLIYRFYELVMVYGTTWKELIQEEFGDGIMSAIDFDMTLERQPDQKGDRVRLTMSGKFLPYKRYQELHSYKCFGLNVLTGELRVRGRCLVQKSRAGAKRQSNARLHQKPPQTRIRPRLSFEPLRRSSWRPTFGTGA